MAKNLKITIKNTQIADAINLGNLKKKLAKNKETIEPQSTPPASQALSKAPHEEESDEHAKVVKEEQAPRVRARSKSAFAETAASDAKVSPDSTEEEQTPQKAEEIVEDKNSLEMSFSSSTVRRKTGEELRKELFGEQLETPEVESKSEPEVAVSPVAETSNEPSPIHPAKDVEESAIAAIKPKKAAESPLKETSNVSEVKEAPPVKRPTERPTLHHRTGQPSYPKDPERIYKQNPKSLPAAVPAGERVKLGPTGRHVNDLLPKKPEPKPFSKETVEEPKQFIDKGSKRETTPIKAVEDDAKKHKFKPKGPDVVASESSESAGKKGIKSGVKEFRDIKPTKRVEPTKTFDARDRHGLSDTQEEPKWRKRRQKAARVVQEDITIRPTTLKIRVPIMIKDLAAEMKLKASQLITKLFLQGLTVTLNDLLDDETTIQLLGHEFGCEITIDSSEEERIRITDKSVKEEIAATEADQLVLRAPVVAFMGHVDHGKTSLIDAIRNTNRVSGEAGAITQHIGAFRCHTAVGDIAILDTPGHEAFSAMRARGADVTDIVVLVVAGDEGIRQQTLEAIRHAQDAKVTIVVAINKCDKPNFNAENVYRQLADNNLLPESWGGEILTVNCSAVTKEGIQTLLETLALQAEILELKANHNMRARGTVLESEMHKGMGSVATVLVQNGTLRIGDSVVFGQLWGRIKTMQDEFGRQLQEAIPSTPVAITGLSGLPEAGQEFIVVKSEREAKEIADVRKQGIRQLGYMQKKKISAENVFQEASLSTKKVLNIVLRADVQGSLEALKAALEKIQSTKAELNIIFAGVGEVSESDIQLAATSKAVVLGFHTQIESHAELLVKELGVQVKLHDIIYHAIDNVKAIMVSLLDKLAIETDKGKAEVRALFKSSQVGIIAGCIVTEGSIHRNHHLRIMRAGKLIGTTSVSSLKRVKEDVREVQKGLECGIVLNRNSDIQEGDILEAYEITYITQEL